MNTTVKKWIRRAVGLGPWGPILVLLIGAGMFATVVRFTQGLGPATNLTDAFPWGLWIGFDVLVGVGLAAGGFVIAAAVHVFGIKKYESVARPTILTAFLGYLLVIVALLFDLGRPWRIWHPLIMWNHHSVMFEVGWCVMLYTTVLALEFSPLVLERFGFRTPLRWIRAVYVPLVIVGVLLSTLHQSSLGTLYVIAADKLHGLWYTPLLPVFFFISAIAGGLSMVIFESFMSRRAFGKRLEAGLLRGLGRVSVVVLAVYVVWRVVDLAARGNLALAFEVTPESTLFWGEMVLGAIVPACLFASRRVRYNESGLLLAALLTIMGFVVGRLNVAITGMIGSSGTSYTPSWMEFTVTLCVVAAGFILFGLAAKHLPVFPDEKDEAPRAADSAIPTPGPRRVVGREVLVSLWILLFVGVVAAVYSTERDEQVDTEPAPCASESIAWPGDNLDLPAIVFFEPAADSPGAVRFDHAVHVDPCDPNCGVCHEAAWSITRKLSPRAGDRSFERIHEGDLCASCHDGTRAFDIADDCVGCHAAIEP